MNRVHVWFGTDYGWRTSVQNKLEGEFAQAQPLIYTEWYPDTEPALPADSLIA
jgi:hypothetical protein